MTSAAIRSISSLAVGTGSDRAAYLGIGGIDAPAIAGFDTMSDAARQGACAVWLAARAPSAAGTPAANALNTFLGTINAPQHRHFVGPDLELPRYMAPGGGRVDDAHRHELFMRLAFAIAGAAFVSDRFEGTTGGHNIASVLRGPDDSILGWGINTGGAYNSTCHGEVNLIQNYHRRNGGAALPAGSILYTTLEPCHMCAGMIAETGPGTVVYYGQADPGIQGNALARQVNGCRQTFIMTIPGANLDVEYTGGAITTFLASEAAEEAFLGARDSYMDRPGSATDANRHIWLAGTRIIETIDPKVAMYRNLA